MLGLLGKQKVGNEPKQGYETSRTPQTFARFPDVQNRLHDVARPVKFWISGSCANLSEMAEVFDNRRSNTTQAETTSHRHFAKATNGQTHVIDGAFDLH